MAGISVIPDFLDHWHTSGKIMFSNMSAIYVLFSLRLKACKPSQMAWSFQTLVCSGLALKPCARSDAFSSCKWVPQLWVLLHLYMSYSTFMIPIEISFQRCFRSDHHFWMVVRIWKSIGDRYGKLSPMEFQFPFNGTTVISKIGHLWLASQVMIVVQWIHSLWTAKLSDDLL